MMSVPTNESFENNKTSKTEPSFPSTSWFTTMITKIQHHLSIGLVVVLCLQYFRSSITMIHPKKMQQRFVAIRNTRHDDYNGMVLEVLIIIFTVLIIITNRMKKTTSLILILKSN